MACFEGLLDSARPFILVEISAANGQSRGAGVDRVRGLALVDTGAESSAIHRAAVDLLHLTGNDSMLIVTSTTQQDLPAYRVRLSVLCNRPTEEHRTASDLRVCEDQSDWPRQATGFEVVAIIGMDVLKNCLLVIDGPNDQFALTL